VIDATKCPALNGYPFFHTLKTELMYLEDFDTREQAQTAVFEYIEVFYNPTASLILDTVV